MKYPALTPEEVERRLLFVEEFWEKCPRMLELEQKLKTDWDEELEYEWWDYLLDDYTFAEMHLDRLEDMTLAPADQQRLDAAKKLREQYKPVLDE